jgi:hypothetical protein
MFQPPTVVVVVISLLVPAWPAPGGSQGPAPVGDAPHPTPLEQSPGQGTPEAMLVLESDAADSLAVPGDRPVFRVPTRAAYRNTFDRSTPLDEISFIPGESNIVVDVTTRLGADMPIAMIAFGVVNRNPRHVIFDATMSIYPDAGGAPDLAHPITSILGNDLWAPGDTALGVARLYLGQASPLTLPPGRLWFGVEISDVRGGDPRLFGQIAADNVTAGFSSGTLMDANASPSPVRLTEFSNVDRTIIPRPDCRADWDLNSRVDSNDLSLFIWDYAYRTGDGDYNADGRIDANDFIAFYADYVGCVD